VVDNTDTEMSVVFKSLGFNVVPAGINEITIALQSGQADTFYAPPVAAAAFQWFALASYMTDFRLTPVVGGLVLSERVWQRIPERYHEELKDSMDRMASAFYAESVRLNEEALGIMEDFGLEHVPVTEEQTEEWMAVMESGHQLMVGEGRSVPTDVYEDFTVMLENLRKEPVGRGTGIE
jgi:TRAP-type transport system periplasmic protein